MTSSVLKYFSDLSAVELYDLLQLRENVFQLEQQCLYRDIDDKDRSCWHLLMYKDQVLVAYARLVPEGVSYEDYVSIGRVVTHPEFRRSAYGIALMEEAIVKMDNLFPGVSVKISAQAYLQKFYERFGFVICSVPYMEDDIPHIAMLLNKS